jgi:ATP-dependent DNA ligase
MIFNPQTDRPDVVDWTGQAVNWVQPKADGHRITIVKDCDGEIHAYSKKPHDLWHKLAGCENGIGEKIHHLAKNWPGSTVIDAEVIVPGNPASAVSTAMAQGTYCRLVPFALPFHNDVDMRIEHDPWKMMGAVLAGTLERMGLALCPTLPFDSTANYVELAREQRLEGFVLKRSHYDGWYKVKPQHTCDMVVMGVEHGNGRLRYLTGALILGLYDGTALKQVCRCGGGMSDVEREQFSGEFILGKVVEVMYQSVAANGGLQFPRFMRVRDDKDAQDCLMSQIR